MKRAIFSLTLLFVTIIGAYAQAPDGVQFGAGIRLAAPSGSFSNISSYGAGIEGQAEFGLDKKVSGVVTTGYTTFFGKDITLMGFTVKTDPIGYIPVLAGVRFYPINQFFIGAQAGYGFLVGNGSSSGGFNYQTQLGFNASKFQLAASYNAITKNSSALSHIGFTGIYKLGSNRKK